MKYRKLKFTPAGLASLKAAQKLRWAKFHAAKKAALNAAASAAPQTKQKRVYSAEGLASRLAGQQRRREREAAERGLGAIVPARKKKRISAAGRAAMVAAGRATAEKRRAKKAGIEIGPAKSLRSRAQLEAEVLDAPVALRNGPLPSAAQLRRAIEIAQEIVDLQDELRAMLYHGYSKA